MGISTRQTARSEFVATTNLQNIFFQATNAELSRRIPASAGQDEDPSTIARPSSRHIVIGRHGVLGFEFTYPIRQPQRVTASVRLSWSPE
jgi:hypothetical protein